MCATLRRLVGAKVKEEASLSSRDKGVYEKYLAASRMVQRSQRSDSSRVQAPSAKTQLEEANTSSTKVDGYRFSKHAGGLDPDFFSKKLELNDPESPSYNASKGRHTFGIIHPFNDNRWDLPPNLHRYLNESTEEGAKEDENRQQDSYPAPVVNQVDNDRSSPLVLGGYTLAESNGSGSSYKSDPNDSNYIPSTSPVDTEGSLRQQYNRKREEELDAATIRAMYGELDQEELEEQFLSPRFVRATMQVQDQARRAMTDDQTLMKLVLIAGVGTWWGWAICERNTSIKTAEGVLDAIKTTSFKIAGHMLTKQSDEEESNVQKILLELATQE